MKDSKRLEYASVYLCPFLNIKNSRMKFILSVLLSLILSFQVISQDRWFNQDLKQDGVYGVSSDKALNDLLKGRTATDIIVAVIDGGTDFSHQDLKNNIWTNPGEIAGNGIDDDHNGYVDDIHGWNFIGSAAGTVRYDNLELTRVYRELNKIYGGMAESSVPADKRAEYQKYKEVKTKFLKKYDDAKENYDAYHNFMVSVDALKEDLGKQKLTNADVLNAKTSVEEAKKALRILQNVASQGGNVEEFLTQIQGAVDHYETEYKYQYNVDYDPRPTLVGDNYSNANEKLYGNTDVKGPDAEHGTHVAGIIGAIRGNGIGMDGVADHVKIMIVRCVPDGDERDKDVANAIRYAVDNGARVINMSFGKYYGTNKAAVDAAVKYAMSKDVLIVHAAGNEGYDLKDKTHYPTRNYEDKSGTATGWIEVGASTSTGQPAEFSCYGKNEVDLFAPGTSIYSTIPDDQYASLQGTSMASPVVAGCAAILRSYFPQLTAAQVREILIKTVTKVPGKVKRPIDDDKQEAASEKHKTLKAKKTKFSKLCQSGGIVNVNNAVAEAIRLTSGNTH
jgi:subtilisin family serine protease